MRRFLWIGAILAVMGGVYLSAPERFERLFDEEVRGIRPATSVQERIISTHLPHGVRIEQAYTIRSDVHENAGIVAASLRGRGYDGQAGVWLLPGSSRGPTTVRTANGTTRQLSPRLSYEQVRSERSQRLVRYVENR